MSKPPAFSHLIGNEQAKTYLNRMIEKQAIGNSLLFSGPSGVGKTLFALAFAKQLLGKNPHPDLYIYRPEGKIGLHSIESMRELCENVYLSPYEAKWKVFIIQDADRMLPTSANALLKTFEEPAPNSVIILISHQPEHLLPTVLSRCRTVHFQALTEELIAEQIKDEKIAALSQGSLGKAYQLQKQGNTLRDQILSALSAGSFRSYSELSKFAKQLAESVETAEELELSKDLSVSQKNQMQKEFDGALRMRKSDGVQQLFHHILSWYRDISLLQNSGNPNLLYHKDHHQVLSQQIEIGKTLPLSCVTEAIQEAKLAFDRSSTLSVCLENLFLKLEML